MPEFFISKANQDIHNDICELKSVTRDLLSATSLFNPKRALRLLAARAFSTSARIHEEKDPDHRQNVAEDADMTQAVPKIEELPDSEIEVPFEDSFGKSQVNRIVSIFATHSTPNDLDIIFPMYQSLKRNDIVLPSIHEYNIVLKSIVMRHLNSDSSPESTESRLTCLLTVYQDVLAACARNAECKPNNETFDIVLAEIFKDAVLVDHGVIDTDAQVAFAKSEEFSQVGLKLFMSVKHPEDLALDQILPNLVTAVNMHPNLIQKDVIVRILDVHDIQSTVGQYYVGLISMASHFQQLDVMNSSEDVYNFISSVFDKFKRLAATHPSLVDSEYAVYSALVRSLISNGNLPIASKFLDEILLDYKRSVPTLEDLLLAELKIHISDLISDYILAIMASGKPDDLNIAYNLLEKFKQVLYIPDLTVQVYNEMINRFINQYTLCEIEKVNGNEGMAKTQEIIYKKIWELYNRAAIRKDFQAGPLMDLTYQVGLRVNCRDFLLSLSLDLSDHAQITRLLKEILLKNHKIADWNVSKKLCLYLYNGVAAYGNNYYADLLWNVVELQATHYYSSSKTLNNFLSEHVSFLLFETPQNFNRVLDSYAVYNAFSGFTLLEDNIYGIMSVATYLMVIGQQSLSAAQSFKLMQMQSLLINQFEDPEHHYLQLSPELIQFRKALSHLFSELYTAAPCDMRTSNDISNACHVLGLDLKAEAKNYGDLDERDFQKDLSALFSVNYPAAVTAFVENFKRGHHFNQMTWSAIINQDFALEVLENDSIIRVSDFVSRLLALNLSSEDEDSLITDLICLNNEKINVEVLKHIIKGDKDILDDVMKAIADFVSISSNRYFVTILTDNMDNILARNSHKFWLTMVFNKLNESGQSDKVVAVLNTAKDKLIYGLDVALPVDEEYLHVVLIALLNLGEKSQTNDIFKHYFDGPNGNKALLKSDILLECLINHYIANGASKDVLKKFGFLQGRSSTINQLLQFAQFMSGLSGEQHESRSLRHDHYNSVGLAVLNENNLLGMKEIFETNKSLVANKDQFFNFLVSILTKAGSLSGSRYNTQICNRFESVVKLCKVMLLREISVDSLISIVRLLALVKATELLNVLLNKFVHGSTLSPYVNFYFLQVDVLKARDASRLLAAFKTALAEVGDEMNAEMISDYEAQLA